MTPQRGPMTSGFLVVDKHGGMTSNQVVGQVKTATGLKKVGHAGTLDPMATGALVVGIGKVTRLIRFIQDQSKEYLAGALFGVATDTLDAEGAVLSREPMDFSPEELEALIPRFTGVISQVPPMVSALKRDGRRLYELAREGQVIERDARPVEIHEIELLSVSPGPYPEVELRVVCGKGTYIRSLVDDLAAVLGGAAHLTSLRRVRVGQLQASAGVTVDDLHNWESYLLTPSQALSDMPEVRVTPETARGVRNGVRFLRGALAAFSEGLPYRVADEKGTLLAIYVNEEDQARPEVVLPT